jgi:hypothetical protein
MQRDELLARLRAAVAAVKACPIEGDGECSMEIEMRWSAEHVAEVAVALGGVLVMRASGHLAAPHLSMRLRTTLDGVRLGFMAFRDATPDEAAAIRMVGVDACLTPEQLAKLIRIARTMEAESC